MARFVVELLYQFEVDTPNVREFVTSVGSPDLTATNGVVVEVLGKNVSYFMVNDKEED